jgi:hypothetical protein
MKYRMETYDIQLNCMQTKVNKTFLLPLAVAQSLWLQGLESFQRTKHLNDDDRKQANKKLRNSATNMV